MWIAYTCNMLMIYYRYMRIVLVLKPYSIEVYSHEDGVYTLMSVEQSTRIENESLSDYEKRMVFVCKQLCTEIRASSFFTQVSKKIKSIEVVLCAPWCTYDVVQVEKDLGKKTKITNAVLTSLFVKKDEKECHVVESYTSNILLNGYKVQSIEDQTAQLVQFQYVHVYAKESFIAPLRKTLETIFHTHEVAIVSIYGLVNTLAQQKTDTHTSELHVIIEEESVDISYVADGLHVVNIFVPHSYMQIEHDIAKDLVAHASVVQEILLSRGESREQQDVLSVDKNAKKLWPDLHEDAKKIIDTHMAKGIEKVVQYIRNCADTIEMEYLKNATLLMVYCVSKKLTTTYGRELAEAIATDPYVQMKIHPTLTKESVKTIF